MPRVTNAPASRRRRKRVLQQAKGYFGNKSRLYRYATEAVNHALLYAYRDRRAKKRTWRALWITRINIACRNAGISYSRFIEGLTALNIEVDRKNLAELAVNDEAGFKTLVEQAREASKAKQAARTINPEELTLVEGVGPKIQRRLQAAGIRTFSDLAAASVDQLKDVIAKAGARFRMMDPKTWPEQAALAAKGEWEAFEKLKAELKGGRRV